MENAILSPPPPIPARIAARRSAHRTAGRRGARAGALGRTLLALRHRIEIEGGGADRGVEHTRLAGARRRAGQARRRPPAAGRPPAKTSLSKQINKQQNT